MSEWRGLYNPQRHEKVWTVSGSADCMASDCGESCTPDRPCYCCVSEDVKRLRCALDNEVHLRIAASNRADLAEAAVQRVEECLGAVSDLCREIVYEALEDK